MGAPVFGDRATLAAARPAPNYRAQRERMVALGRHPTGFALAGADHPGQGHTCGDCAHHYVRQFAGRYHKCDLIRATGGPASDIRVRWPACEHWEAEAQDG